MPNYTNRISGLETIAYGNSAGWKVAEKKAKPLHDFELGIKLYELQRLDALSDHSVEVTVDKWNKDDEHYLYADIMIKTADKLDHLQDMRYYIPYLTETITHDKYQERREYEIKEHAKKNAPKKSPRHQDNFYESFAIDPSALLDVSVTASPTGAYLSENTLRANLPPSIRTDRTDELLQEISRLEFQREYTRREVTRMEQRNSPNGVPLENIERSTLPATVAVQEPSILSDRVRSEQARLLGDISSSNFIDEFITTNEGTEPTEEGN